MQIKKRSKPHHKTTSIGIGTNEQVEVYWTGDPDHKWGTLETDAEPRLSFCRFDGLLINLDEDNDLDKIVTEVLKRRNAQDIKHGGPAHDDTHSMFDWIGFMQKFLNRADRHLRISDTGRSKEAEVLAYEDNLIDVAALAVAAIQSSRRKRNA